ncbi:MAG: YceI family protein, partial [Saprospiraceae bacterium]
MKIALVFLTNLGLLAAASAEMLAFDFKDPKGVNNVVFKLDAPLESINGTASGVTGIITTDPENFTETKGKILIDANTLMLPNPLMQQHLQGEGWLDVKKNSEISLEVKSVADVKKDGASS